MQYECTEPGSSALQIQSLWPIESERLWLFLVVTVVAECRCNAELTCIKIRRIGMRGSPSHFLQIFVSKWTDGRTKTGQQLASFYLNSSHTKIQKSLPTALKEKKSQSCSCQQFGAIKASFFYSVLNPSWDERSLLAWGISGLTDLGTAHFIFQVQSKVTPPYKCLFLLLKIWYQKGRGRRRKGN